MDTNEQQQAMGKIIAKAWADEAFKQRFINDPKAVMREEGVPVPDGLIVKVVENTPSLTHILLPQTPDEELNDEELDRTSGGVSLASGGNCLTTCDACTYTHCGCTI